jgi:hypothetical protein
MLAMKKYIMADKEYNKISNKTIISIIIAGAIGGIIGTIAGSGFETGCAAGIIGFGILCFLYILITSVFHF